MKLPLTFASFGLLGAILLPLSSPSQTAAAESLLFGQKHAYSAVVRDDKRVVTYGKVFLTNPKDTAIKEASFSLPKGVKVSNLSIYQITLPERCDSELDDKKAAKKVISPEIYNPSITCEQLEQQAFNFDRYSIYYAYDSSSSVDSQQLIYKEISPKQTGGTYNFKLPEAIEPSKRGAYLVAYMAEDGYVTGSLGLYNLTFKTLRVPSSIEEVRVSVDVSKDLYTRAKPSDINPAKSESVGVSDALSADDGAGITSRSLDTLQSSIGSGGTFTKTGKALTPNEEFVVNGEFADAEWKLHFWWIVGGVLGGIAVIGLTIFLLKKAASQEVKSPSAKGEDNAK